ncbi:transposase [Vagococcus intermedius]|uniref:Transposase n=1 Tax=Vagococcus intermedius TaxID=2991418 RepID=A0AAF0CUC7_9ENTE|nr:transposase [Vagococcus intermedius]WEG73032.1 transposase [Vagococcus intermedius]WEG75117.1 transposase [Vagococcus intermedius]
MLFASRILNGVTKGLNNKIKVIKRVAYGYRNFYHFHSRIYIIQVLLFHNNKKGLIRIFYPYQT